MKVAVLMGGTSPEREISLKSGRAVLNALRSKGTEVLGVVVEEESWSWFEANLPRADVYFLALHGGRGEDGTVQSILERMGLPYTGSGPVPSSIAMDKVKSRLRFSKAGLADLSWMVVRKGEIRFPEFGLPWVIKPATGGSSIGLSVVKREEEFLSAVERAFEISDTVLVEEYLSGRELTVGIFADRVLEPIEIVPKESALFDYKSKYTKGKTEYIIPPRISEDLKERVKDAGKKAYQVLGCRDYGRVDIILDWQERVVVLEVNTLPGMTETSLLPMACKYEGISFEDMCWRLCEMARERIIYEEKEKRP